MEKVSILVLLLFNIALPTLDTFTDIKLVVKLYRGAQGCEREFDDYWKCWDDPVSYCSNGENNQALCRFNSHPKMATAMLTPFLLNYIVCFITFLRKEKNKKFTFIFALLDIYPQFGKHNHYKRNHCNNYFQYFRGRKNHLPSG